MKTAEFSKLMKEVRTGNVKGITKASIEQMTKDQAMKIEDTMLDLTLTKDGNNRLDILTAYIMAETVEEKKVANTKAPVKKEAPKQEEIKEAPKAPAKKPAPKKTTPEAPQAPEKDTKEAPKTDTKAPKKTSLKGNKTTEEKISKGLTVGQIIQFRVEGEEVETDIKIV